MKAVREQIVNAKLVESQLSAQPATGVALEAEPLLIDRELLPSTGGDHHPGLPSGQNFETTARRPAIRLFLPAPRWDGIYFLRR